MSAPIGLNQVAMPGGGSGTSSAAGATFPLSGLGLLGASNDPASSLSVGTIGNNTVFGSRVWFPSGPVTGLWCAVRDAGTWDGVTTGSTLGYYTDAGVFIDKIGVNDALWATNKWVGGALAGGPEPVPGGGQWGYLLALVRGMTAQANVAFQTSPNDANTWYDTGPAGSGATHRRAFFLGGQTALPGSFDPTSVGTASTFNLLIGYN